MTQPTSVVSVSDGSEITIREIIGNPLWVPSAMLKLMENQFISEALFRNGGSNPSGVVAYTIGNPSFLADDVQTVAEFGEIPVSYGPRGLPQTAFATKTALGVRVSKEMIDQNRVGAVMEQMRQLKNTFIRANDHAVRNLLQSAVIPTVAVPTAWSAGGSPRTDIANGMYTISSAAPANFPTGIGSPDEYFGFEADTMVLHPAQRAVLMNNAEFMQIYYSSPLASEAPTYTGTLPGNLMGLNVIESRAFPMNKVLLLQRGTVGFYSDNRPLQFTALYPEGNGPNGGPTESWRSDASQIRALAVDQPAAALWLTGI